MQLFDYLKQKNLTQRQFAQKIDETDATISRIVNGETWISERLAKKIIAATDGHVTPNDFFAARTPLTIQKDTAPLNTSPTPNKPQTEASDKGAVRL